MDRKTVIGLVLIFLLFFVWAQINSSSREKLQEQQNISQAAADTLQKDPARDTGSADSAAVPVTTDTSQAAAAQDQLMLARYGGFIASAQGEAGTETLSNELFDLEFNTKGGFLSKATLKNHFRILQDSQRNETKIPLTLLNEPGNRFNYTLPVSGTAEGRVNTSDLYFRVHEKTANSITLRAMTSQGGFFEQKYSIAPGSYNIDYSIRIEGLGNAWKSDARSVVLTWDDYLRKLEINEGFERTYSTVYFRKVKENPDYCNCREDDQETVGEAGVQWFSHANQFFNSSLISTGTPFMAGTFSTKMLPDTSKALKLVRSEVQIPLSPETASYEMDLYVGPNEFKELRSYGVYLEDIIPFGSSIFGSINRWVVRPIFDFLSGFIGNAGIVILLLTLLVKLLLSPLTYKMLYSQAKMAALKPEMEQLREKYKDDQQQQQVETMKLYREFGVNPLGGCLPMLLQMPIWFALYRFFPAAIDFRQASFLWATDLSSYDVIFYLPFQIPFYGEHVSLFTLLWAVTTVIYTWYNSKLIDMNAINPAMKYLQYFMPIMFIFFFNSFAAGLACYLFFSNVLNIGQTLLIKNYLIDSNKIRQELEANKKKPKKKSGFSQRLEDAMKEQQRIAREKGNKK